MIPTATKSLKLDAEVHEGVHFHVAATSLTSEDLVALLGREIEVVLGIGPDRLYLGVGGHALESLKEAITKSKAAAGKEVPPLRIAVAGTPLGRLRRRDLGRPRQAQGGEDRQALEKIPRAGPRHLDRHGRAPGLSGAVGNRRGPVEGPGRVVPTLLLPDPTATLRGSIPLRGSKGGEKGEPDPFDND